MKLMLSYNRMIRRSSLIVPLVIGALSALVCPGFHLELIVCVVVVANSLLFLIPLRYERARLSLLVAGIYSFCCIAAALFCRTSENMLTVITVVSVLSSMIHLIIRLYSKFSHIRLLYSSDWLLQSAQDAARASLLCLLFLLFSAVLVAELYNSIFFLILISVSGLALFVIQYCKAYMGRTFLITAKAESEISEIQNSALKLMPDSCSTEFARMTDTYHRLINYMEEDRPYLNPGLSIESVARDLGVNRTYLSRIVNSFAEKNFSQFINKYRVDYAVELFKENPRMKMMEVAMASGFRTVVSFNMVFKLFMSLTPSEYAANVRFP